MHRVEYTKLTPEQIGGNAMKIRTIYTAMFYPPPELAVPNWPPFDGNWPLPATIVPAPAAPRQP